MTCVVFILESFGTTPMGSLSYLADTSLAKLLNFCSFSFRWATRQAGVLFGSCNVKYYILNSYDDTKSSAQLQIKWFFGIIELLFLFSVPFLFLIFYAQTFSIPRMRTNDGFDVNCLWRLCVGKTNSDLPCLWAKAGFNSFVNTVVRLLVKWDSPIRETYLMCTWKPQWLMKALFKTWKV